MNGLMRFWISAALTSASAVNASQAQEQGTPARPEAACTACHGPGGSHPVTPDTPRLAGQEFEYLVHALGQYRSGARQNPIMGAMAKTLSDQQIEALARYFSSQHGLRTKY